MGELQHGTVNTYMRHKCRCDACRKANADRARAGRQKRAAATPIEQVPHGVNGYINYDCRCETCKAAGLAAHEQQNEARRSRVKDAPHGTRSGYQSWGCRCVACVRAENDHRIGWSKERNDRSRDTAHHHRDPWTGPELEVAARAYLSHRDVSQMLGRTVSAVIHIRRKLRTDEKVIRFAGISSPDA